jgi:predicted alpha/beta hydrolase family esterase
MDQVTPIVIVPGLRDHVPEHWQTLLEQKLPHATSVPRMKKNKLSRACWIELLDRTLAVVETPPILVAHSAGCMIVAHWAKRYERPIKGALLATPPDLERPLPDGYPTMDALLENGWLPTPRDPLPFLSIVATSGNDPLGKLDRVIGLAQAWGSRRVHLGDVGHLNPAAGFGEWTDAEILIEDLAQPETRSVPTPAGVGRAGRGAAR